MGQLEQFAKQLFEEETAALTGGAVAWQGPVELGLSEVRLDGLLIVNEHTRLASLAAPWSLVGASDEVVLELKMPGDHLNPLMVERALLRRQARQVVRFEADEAAAPGQVPLWVVAPHRPRWLETGQAVAPGCYRLAHTPFTFLWVAANELPLCDELVPFLMARSGASLDAFVRWVAGRRPTAWVLRVVQFLPMSPALRDELMRQFPATDDPEVRERQRFIVQTLLDKDPEFEQALATKARNEGLEKGLEKGLKQGRELEHERLWERRLGRALSEGERQTLHERWGRLGADRLGAVLLDSSAETLAAWLADPEAR
jgi:hypothetical protein